MAKIAGLAQIYRSKLGDVRSMVALTVICLPLVSGGVLPSHAAELLLPSKSEALSLPLSDKSLFSSYDQADGFCRAKNFGLSSYYGCAQRDIVASVLRHRGYCLNNECKTGSKDRWYRCDFGFSLSKKGLGAE